MMRRMFQTEKPAIVDLKKLEITMESTVDNEFSVIKAQTCHGWAKDETDNVETHFTKSFLYPTRALFICFISCFLKVIGGIYMLIYRIDHLITNVCVRVC